VLTLATGDPYVTADLTAHQATQARRGMPASIVAADQGLTARGMVTRVGSLPPVGGPPPHGYPILVKPMRALPQAMIGARVRLTVEAPVTSEPVLTVPLAAFVSAGRGHAGHVVVLRRAAGSGFWSSRDPPPTGWSRCSRRAGSATSG